MKLKLIAGAVLAALTATAMPTKDAQIEMAEHMKRIVIPSFSFKPRRQLRRPSFSSAIKASSMTTRPCPRTNKRGIRFVLKAGDADKLAKTPVPKLSAKNISLYNAFNLVCEATGLMCRFGKQQEIVIESLK